MTVADAPTKRRSRKADKENVLVIASASNLTIPLASRFGSEQFMDAPDLSNLADTLLAKHDSLRHLRGMDIRYLWKKKGGDRKGKSHLGDTLKPSGLIRYGFNGPSFIVWLAADHLEAWSLEQIEPLLYHELLRAQVDEDGDPYIAAPDFEGFIEELRAYGPWHLELRSAVKAVQQLALPEEDSAPALNESDHLATDQTEFEPNESANGTTDETAES